MGVFGFGSWLFKNKNRPLVVDRVPSNVASLSFDLNSIIHGCAQIVYSYGEAENDTRTELIKSMTDEELEKELFEMIGAMVLRVVNYVNPKNILVLAVDGIAPLAKINQQRSRRYRGASMNHGSDMRFDPNCITPGTEFMIRLDKYLQDWIQFRLNQLPEKVLYSSHLVPGEGEQKIFDYVRDFEISGYGAHVIYGLDADLIILSLISRLKGIYLIREKTLQANVYEKLVSIEQIREYLKERMRTPTALDDFAVLSFFLGNDFIPTSPMFSGDMFETLEYLINLYIRNRKSLTIPEEGKIHIQNFKNFVKLIAKSEDDRLKAVFHNLPKMGFQTLELAMQQHMQLDQFVFKLNKDEFQKNWYTKVFSPPLSKTEMAFQLPDDLYMALFEPTNEKVEDLVQDYITAFLWTYLYYKNGTSKVSPNFCYRSGYAPLIEDVATFFPYEVYPITMQQIKKNYSLPVLQQLLAVLPPQSLNIIPVELHPFYQVDSPILDLFPIKVEVDTEGKELERLGVVRMPLVEPGRLLDLKIEMSERRRKMFEPMKNLMFIREVKKTIDRSLTVSKLTLEKEIVQEDINPADQFSYLDALVPIDTVIMESMPSTTTVFKKEVKKPEIGEFRKAFDKLRGKKKI
jgi:5'-3' exoribonuclease 1